MTARPGPLARISAVACLVCAPVVASPPAGAVTPPRVDESRLPPSGSPRPPHQTEQADACVIAPTTSPTGAGGQLADMDLQSVWALTRGSGQTVAVIDTGVARHRLLPRLIPGGDYVSSGDGTEDCDGHGTVVAGIIGASSDPRTGSPFSGIAPDATLVAIRQSSNKFRAAEVAGTGFGDVDTLAAAVRTAADMGATVINISTVACVPAEPPLDDRALGAALAYAVDVKNVVVVAAAGNVGTPGQCPEQNPTGDPAAQARPDWSGVAVVVSPAWYDDYVLTVGSVGPDGAPSAFSLAGPWVDVAAHGEGIVSLDPDGEGLIDAMPTPGGEKPITGTSYAAPVVTGVVALLRSRSPQLTARQVMQRIEDTTRPSARGWDPVVGHGVVDVLAAVTGSAPSRLDRATAPTTVAPREQAPQENRSTRLAVQASAACVVIAMLGGVLALSARRSRR